MADKVERSESQAKQERVEYQAKSVLKSLHDLDPELLEDISIGAETELAQRESEEKGGLTHISEIADDIDKAFGQWGKVSGLSTGYPLLDAKIGGLKKGEIILIAGDPGNGKSAIAQNIAVNVARDHGVLFITLEMLMVEAGQRIKHMNLGKLDNLNLMFQSEQQIDYRHLDTLFENGVDVGVELVILDYLQYMGRGMNLDEVAKMSQVMKKLALKYKLPFIIIVSLRKGDGGKFRRKWTDVELEDLMGTAAIGYDTDVAMVASRKDLENEYDKEHFYLKVLKTRGMNLDYDDRYLMFNWDKTRITEQPDYGWIPNIPAEQPDQEGSSPLPYKD